MSTDAGIETPVGTEAVTEPSGSAPEVTPAEETGADNPAWKSLLDKLPTSLHELVKPDLKEWDSGVTKKFQDIHDTYAPYKSFAEQKVEAEELQQAYQLFQALQADPEAVYKRMAEYYGYGATAPVETPTEPTPTPNANALPVDFGDPALNAWMQEQTAKSAQQEALLVQMGQLLLSERQTAADAQLEQQQSQLFDTEQAKAKEKYGDIVDNPLVTTLVAQFGDFDKAVEIVKQTIDNELTARSRPPVPTVLSGSGGSLPTPEAPDLAKMSSKDTRNLVVEMLKSAKATT